MARVVAAAVVGWRRPLLGRFGQVITAGLCLYEAVALVPFVPLPTISEIVWRHGEVGLVLLVLLAHHWYAEDHGPRALVALEYPRYAPLSA